MIKDKRKKQKIGSPGASLKQRLSQSRHVSKRFGVQGPFLKRPWQVQGGALVASSALLNWTRKARNPLLPDPMYSQNENRKPQMAVRNFK